MCFPRKNEWPKNSLRAPWATWAPWVRMGPMGPVGTMGPMGPTGPHGSHGSHGPQGPRGQIGPFPMINGPKRKSGAQKVRLHGKNVQIQLWTYNPVWYLTLNSNLESKCSRTYPKITKISNSEKYNLKIKMSNEILKRSQGPFSTPPGANL